MLFYLFSFTFSRVFLKHRDAVSSICHQKYKLGEFMEFCDENATNAIWRMVKSF
jgi:hypothetical protein